MSLPVPRLQRFIAPENPDGVLLDYSDDSTTPEGALKRALLRTCASSELVTATSSWPRLAAAHGMGGVGKTCALRGLCFDEDVWQRFPDGVFFFTLGKDATASYVIALLAHLVESMDMLEQSNRIRKCTSVRDAVDIAALALSGLRCLLLLDDLWSTESCKYGHLEELRHVLDSSESSRIVFSTRSRDALGARDGSDEHPGLTAALQHSLSAMDEELESDDNGYRFSATDMYLALSVLEKQAWMPLYDLCYLWGVDAERAKVIAKQFNERTLLAIQEFQDLSESETQHYVFRVILHDLALDFCKRQAEVNAGEGLHITMNTYRRKRADRAVEAALRHGTTRLCSVRVLLMGGSTRGKTSTVESLLGHAFVPDRESTVGIELETHYLVPGSRGLSPSEIEDRAIRMESYASAISRVDEEQALRAMSTPAASSSRSTSAAPLDPSDAAKRISKESSIGSAPRSGASDEHGELLKTTREAMRAPVGIEGESGHVLRIWDFGGQKEYEMCHQLFISQRSVLMFAVDLQKLWCTDSREEEFDELLLWLKCAFTLTEGPGVQHATGVQHVVVVGTRKSKCDNVEGAWEALEDLISKWSDTVYDAWVRTPPDGESRMQMIALENDGAIDDAEGSGLLELEKHLWSITKEIIESSQPVPVRWRALLEELVRAGGNKLFLTKEYIVGIADGFPGFEQTSDGLELTVMTILRYFRDLGELVLFEMSSEIEGNPSGEVDTCIVFVNPDKLLSVLRAIIGPCRRIVRCLKAYQKKELQDRGIVDMDALDVLWENCVPKPWRLTMLNMLCSFDLLVRLEWHEGGRRVIGIPALMPCLGRDDASFEERMRSGSRGHNEEDLVVFTVFTEFFPTGLIGALVANLHKTVGGERTTVHDVRADAVLLRLNKGERVLVRYVQQSCMGPHIKWWLLGREPVDIARRCLRQFNALMQAQFRKVSIASYKHLMITDCEKDLECCVGAQANPISPGRGCGSKESVELEIDSESLRDDDKRRELRFSDSECNRPSCYQEHKHAPLKDRVRGSPALAGQAQSALNKPSSKRYDLLVCSNGEEKLSGLGKSAVALWAEVGDLARTVESHVAAFAAARGRAPSVYSMSTHGDIYDAVMQLRGGGVALFLLTLAFFRNERCLTALLSCMHYAENGRNGSGVQLRFVCLERDVEDIFKDEIVKSRFPKLKDEYVVLTVEDGTIVEMAHHVAEEILWEAWTRPQEGEKYAVLGEDIEKSFDDLTSQSFFSEAHFSIVRSRFLREPNHDVNCLLDVFLYAKAKNRIGYTNVDALADIVTRLVVQYPTDAHRIDSALSAYKSKWLLAGRWGWGSSEKDKLKNVVLPHLVWMDSG